MFKYTGRIRCSALTDLVLKCFSDTSVPRRGGGGVGGGVGWCDGAGQTSSAGAS